MPPARGVQPRKVLVVDDERDLADMAGALLDSHGLETQVAYGGSEALRMLAADPAIDAVFSDVMMPGMTGLELADTVARQHPAVRIVLTSGFTAPALFARHPAYPFASKPYSIEHVIALLRGEQDVT
jgi:CheY-like chemotaxis protein